MTKVLVAAAVIGLLALTSCASEPTKPVDTRTKLQVAKEDCIKGSTVGFESLDAGKSVTMRTPGKKAPNTQGLEVEQVNCMLKAVGASSATIAKMQQTRALDGTQRDSWDAFEASWTYHPDAGLNVILVEKK